MLAYAIDIGCILSGCRSFWPPPFASHARMRIIEFASSPFWNIGFLTLQILTLLISRKQKLLMIAAYTVPTLKKRKVGRRRFCSNAVETMQQLWYSVEVSTHRTWKLFSLFHLLSILCFLQSLWDVFSLG